MLRGYLFRLAGTTHGAAPMKSTQASREERLVLLGPQQAAIVTLEARMHELERRLTPGGP